MAEKDDKGDGMIGWGRKRGGDKAVTDFHDIKIKVERTARKRAICASFESRKCFTEKQLRVKLLCITT